MIFCCACARVSVVLMSRLMSYLNTTNKAVPRNKLSLATKNIKTFGYALEAMNCGQGTADKKKVWENVLYSNQTLITPRLVNLTAVCLTIII